MGQHFRSAKRRLAVGHSWARSSVMEASEVTSVYVGVLGEAVVQRRPGYQRCCSLLQFMYPPRKSSPA